MSVIDLSEVVKALEEEFEKLNKEYEKNFKNLKLPEEFITIDETTKSNHWCYRRIWNKTNR